MHRRSIRRKGFTLVELLVVVLILAILTAVALPLYIGAVMNAEKRTARSNMHTIATAEQAYKLRSSTYIYLGGSITAIYGSNGLEDLENNVVGPGTRSYTVNLAPTADCNDADGVSRAVPDGSFSVTSSEPTDGCFIPGVTSE